MGTSHSRSQVCVSPYRGCSFSLEGLCLIPGNKKVPNENILLIFSRTLRKLGYNPFRTAVPFWEQITWNLSGLSPKRDCGSKRVKKNGSVVNSTLKSYGIAYAQGCLKMAPPIRILRLAQIRCFLLAGPYCTWYDFVEACTTSNNSFHKSHLHRSL